jgi:hypothetical protein
LRAAGIQTDGREAELLEQCRRQLLVLDVLQDVSDRPCRLEPLVIATSLTGQGDEPDRME